MLRTEKRRRLFWLLSIWSVTLFPFTCQFFVEWVRLQQLGAALLYLPSHLPGLLLGTLFISGLALFFSLLTARPWVGAAVTGGILFLSSYVNFYKLTYRGDPVLPMDVVITGDAAKVATELSIPPTFQMGCFFVFVSMSILLLFPIRLRFLVPMRLPVRLAGAAGSALFCGLYLTLVLWNGTVQQKIGVDTTAFQPSKSYENGSFATSFLMYTGAVPPKKPANYSEETVQAAAERIPEQDHAQQRRPDIIVVMLESYYRLDNVEGAVYDTNLTENYDRYAAKGISGYYYSDKYSGGTEGMEFGALTGFSTSLLPTGSISYVSYVEGEFPCYPRFLSENGYKTIALHPYDPTIYNRDEAYAAMGFDEFYSEEDFENPTQHGAYIDDLATAEKLIELYEEASADGSNVFLHTVTMQNHIPNDPDEYDPDYAVGVSLDGVDEYFVKSLSSVATGLRDADQMIGYLCDYFSQSDRVLVLLFFGDHQTAIGDRKGEELLDQLDCFGSLSGEEKLVATHKVPYLMWANFEEMDGQQINGMPPYQLLAATTEAYDLIRPGWFSFLAESRQTMTGVNLGQVIGPDGSFSGSIDDAPEEWRQLWQDQTLLQYDAMFGEGYAHQQMYG